MARFLTLTTLGVLRAGCVRSALPFTTTSAWYRAVQEQLARVDVQTKPRLALLVEDEVGEHAPA